MTIIIGGKKPDWRTNSAVPPDDYLEMKPAFHDDYLDMNGITCSDIPDDYLEMKNLPAGSLEYDVDQQWSTGSESETDSETESYSEEEEEEELSPASPQSQDIPPSSQHHHHLPPLQVAPTSSSPHPRNAPGATSSRSPRSPSSPPMSPPHTPGQYPASYNTLPRRKSRSRTSSTTSKEGNSFNIIIICFKSMEEIYKKQIFCQLVTNFNSNLEFHVFTKRQCSLTFFGADVI